MFLAGRKFVRRNGNVAQNIDDYFEENLSYLPMSVSASYEEVLLFFLIIEVNFFNVFFGYV